MPPVDITTQDEQVIRQLFDMATGSATAGTRLQVAAAALTFLQKIDRAKKEIPSGD